MKRPDFVNEAFLNFSDPNEQQKVQKALGEVEKQFGREYDLVIGGKHVKAPDQFASHNPSNPEEVLGLFQLGTPELGVKAIETAAKAFETWQYTPAEKRAELVFKVADGLRERRALLSAWLVLEVGKSWVEADADVAEAIDLVEFYGHETLRYGGPQPVTPVPNEKPSLRYIPLGVGIVIPPWNFPIAIMAGMTTAAFAAGNTVVLKPSSQAPGCAAKFVELLEDIGIPPGVVNLMTGPGGKLGEALVAHPKTRFISFTGSKEVGLRINELAARHQPGQIWIKRVVAEMGGKNAIIVDNEVNLQAAVEGVAVSVFGYSGQKCSACSRAIVVKDVYDEFVAKLAERTKAVTVGDVRDRANYMGPVISLDAMSTILNYIEIGRREGKLLIGGKQMDRKGYFVEPTIFADVDRKAVIAQEEIFGPVLAVIKAKDFEDALEITNGTEYGLTGSLYTTNRKKMEVAADRFHVGNLYFNRKSTGAMVGGHPFGGFNMS
ncbi:MAG: L-glutamate gamma-semialdehyde dehydrogenase, partial [Armatimonadetes bacterium]|nr:L-glutamate gamma-semialdehyde dehydrogenase [Armatimonadota bacterium]